MPSPSVTYTFSNSTTADATQVTQNFTDIINGLTDGTKDLSINALTLAGNFTANGNTTIGNASSDTITTTATWASHLNPSAHNTYDFGTVTTLGWRAFYFASSSATKTAKLQGPAISSDIIVTLPSITSTIEIVPTFAAKTTTYTTTASDRIITCDATSAAFTVNLVAASGNAGLIQRFIKTDSSFNAVTLDGNASETIRGATTFKLCTQYDAVTLICDGSNWHIMEHTYPSVWTAYTVSITGSTSNPTKGTGTVIDQGYWRRVGDSVEIRYEYAHTVAGSAGSGRYLFSLPSGLTYNSSKANANTGNAWQSLGAAYAYDSTNNAAVGVIQLDNTATGSVSIAFGTSAVRVGSGQLGDLSIATVNMGYEAKIPVTSWEG